MKWNYALLLGMDKGNVELDVGIGEQAGQLAWLGRMMELFGRRVVERRPIETRHVELGSRVGNVRGEDEERGVLEI
jgi:hypothetical protein